MKRILLLVLASALPLAAQTITPPSSEPPFSGALGAGDYYIVLHTDGKLYIASAAQMQAQVQTGMVASSAINASALTALGSAPNTSGGFLAYSAIGANVEAWSTKLDRLSALSDPGAIRVLQIDASGNLSWVAATTPTISIGSNGTGVLSYSSGVLNLINTPNAANALVQLDGSAGIPAGLLGNYIGTTVQAYNANLTTLGAGNPFTFADFTVTGTWPQHHDHAELRHERVDVRCWQRHALSRERDRHPHRRRRGQCRHGRVDHGQRRGRAGHVADRDRCISEWCDIEHHWDRPSISQRLG